MNQIKVYLFIKFTGGPSHIYDSGQITVRQNRNNKKQPKLKPAKNIKIAAE